MSDKPATRKDIDDVLNVLKGFVQQTSEQFGEVNDRFDKMDDRFQKIDGRFETIDGRLDKMDGRFEKIDGRLDKMDNRFEMLTFNIDTRFNKIELEIVDLKKTLDHLMTTLDKFVGRIDDYETEQTARDSQFEKLLDWARKVSKKTGIPLENL